MSSNCLDNGDIRIPNGTSADLKEISDAIKEISAELKEISSQTRVNFEVTTENRVNLEQTAVKENKVNAESEKSSKKDVRYETIDETRTSDVVHLLENSFFLDEPLGKAMGVRSPEDVHFWLGDFIKQKLAFGLSVGAIDEVTGELVGVIINVPKERNVKQCEMLDYLDPQRDWRLFEVATFLQSIYSRWSPFDEFHVDKLFSIAFLNVSQDYGGQGIAQTLVRQSVEMARERDFKVLATETTGIFSAKAFQKFGFKCCRTFDYKDYTKDGQVVFKDTGVHDATRAMVLVL